MNHHSVRVLEMKCGLIIDKSAKCKHELARNGDVRKQNTRFFFFSLSLTFLQILSLSKFTLYLQYRVSNKKLIRIFEGEQKPSETQREKDKLRVI